MRSLKVNLAPSAVRARNSQCRAIIWELEAEVCSVEGLGMEEIAGMIQDRCSLQKASRLIEASVSRIGRRDGCLFFPVGMS